MSVDQEPRAMMNYEEAVQHLRSDPASRELIRDSYLGENVHEEAARFAASDEWNELFALLRAEGVFEGSRVIDLGCGSGIVSAALSGAGYRVCAIDPDLSAEVGLGALQDLMRNCGQDSITPVAAFAESLPIGSNRVQAVYLRQAVHHFTNLEVGIAECARVLKPGGVLIASREHVVSDGQQKKEFLENHPMQALHGGENAYRVKEYLSALQGVGLRVRKVLGPFDTAINYHPTRKDVVFGWLEDGLSRRVGRGLARKISRYPLIRKLYLRRLSRKCRYPGRLYTFVAQK